MAVTIKGPGPVPQDAIDYFRAKGWKIGFDYRDVWREEHAFSFTVAKATQIDVMDSIRNAIDTAIAQGMTKEKFGADLTPVLQKLGWWGKKDMTDPVTGEPVTAQLGSPRRLRTIYDVNLRTARAAGQWKRAERTKKAFPYLRYGLGPSEHHRPKHVAWNGITLPVDSPWWNTHMPINGYG